MTPEHFIIPGGGWMITHHNEGEPWTTPVLAWRFQVANSVYDGEPFATGNPVTVDQAGMVYEESLGENVILWHPDSIEGSDKLPDYVSEHGKPKPSKRAARQ